MKNKMLFLNTSEGKLYIGTDNIIRIQAMSNYCKLFFANGDTLVTAKILRWFQERLPGETFTRPHRSHLVNLHYVKTNQYINKSFLLANGECIPVSRRWKKKSNGQRPGGINIYRAARLLNAV